MARFSRPIPAPALDDFTNVLDWLEAMEVFFLKHDYNAWLCIQSRYTPPTITVNDETIPKPLHDFTAEEKAILRMHDSARNAISCALPGNFLPFVDGCVSAKEAWDRLYVYGVLDLVRRMKHLYSLYDTCTMKPSQTFNEFYYELMGTVLCLSKLGARLETLMLVKKILGSLSGRFRDKVSEIVDSKDLDTIGLDELWDILVNYEADMLLSKKWKCVVYVEDSSSSEFVYVEDSSSSNSSLHSERKRLSWKKLDDWRDSLTKDDSKSVDFKNMMKVLVPTPSTDAIKEDSKSIEFKNIMKVMVPSSCASTEDSKSNEFKNIMKVMIPAPRTCA